MGSGTTWCLDCGQCASQPCPGSGCTAPEFFRVLTFMMYLLASPLVLGPVGLLLSKAAALVGRPRGDHVSWNRCWMLTSLFAAGVCQWVAAFFALYAHDEMRTEFTLVRAPPPPNQTLGPDNVTATLAPLPNIYRGSTADVAEAFGLNPPCDPRFTGVGMFSAGFDHLAIGTYMQRCTDAGSKELSSLKAMQVFQGSAMAATFLAFVLLNALLNVLPGLALTTVSLVAQLIVYGLATTLMQRLDFCRAGLSLESLGFRRYTGVTVQPYAMVCLTGCIALLFKRAVDRAADPDSVDPDAPIREEGGRHAGHSSDDDDDPDDEIRADEAIARGRARRREIAGGTDDRDD